MGKPELEFFDQSSVEWTNCAGQVPGLVERILARDDVSGTVTRLLRFPAGIDTSANGVQRHEFWEEVYIVAGSIIDTSLNQEFTEGMYACRPPGMPHGPWISPRGCLTFEVRYALDR